jgi:hypothetical protein
VKWNKYKGTIKGKCGCEATIEMMDLPDPHWFCRFESLTSVDVLLEVKGFEVGQLEEAHTWCMKQITEDEERKAKRNPC